MVDTATQEAAAAAALEVEEEKPPWRWPRGASRATPSATSPPWSTSPGSSPGPSSPGSSTTKMKMPKSKTALSVLKKADTSCKIWFVCKEHLICTREAGASVSRNAETPPASRNSISTLSERGGQPNGYASNAVDGQIQRSISEKVVPASVRTSLRLPSRLSVRTTLSRLSMEDSSVHSWDSVPRGSFPSSHQASSTVTDEGFSDSSSFSTPTHDASEILPSVHVVLDLQNPVSYHEQNTI